MTLIYNGRTVTRVAINQGAAGTTDVVAAVAGLFIYVVSFAVTLDAALSTLTFRSGTGPTDLTGAMKFADSGGMVAIGTPENPVLKAAAAGDKLSIFTVTGKAQGWLNYLVDPK
jgi:hypothetical protein